MTIELTEDEVETLRDSLKYSQRAITDRPDTPNEVRKQNLARVEAVSDKLRSARRAAKS